LSSGGAKRSLYEFTKRLAHQHQIDAYTLSCAEHEFADIRPFVNNHYVQPFKRSTLFKRPFGRLNQLSYLSDLFRLDQVDKRIASQVDHGNYDIVFVHHCRYRQSPGLLRYLQTPSVYYCQEPPRKIYDPPIPRPYESDLSNRKRMDRFDPLPALYINTLKRLDKQNVSKCKHILVNSHHSHENVWRVYRKRPEVCYLGVDTDEFMPIPCPKENLVLAVGTLNPIKGYDLLIEGVSRLPSQTRPEVVIISNFADSREKQYLDSMAGDIGVRLSVKPIINEPKELAGWYSRAAVTGYTPVLEPLGLVSLESMACETPVVGVREGGVRETVLDGSTGVLVERNPDDLADGLSFILSDAVRAAEMGRRGRAWVQEKWTWERSVSKVEAALIAAAENGVTGENL
jgi:glycosyltransferase involved in cell wall biosynthesis